MSECPSARCRAAVGIDWHLVCFQVITRRWPAVSIPIGSLSGRRRLCLHSSGNPTSARCQYAHRVTVGPTPAFLATRPRSAVGPRIGSQSGQCRICSAYARHLLGKPTPSSGRGICRSMLSSARHRADVELLAGMLVTSILPMFTLNCWTLFFSCNPLS